MKNDLFSNVKRKYIDIEFEVTAHDICLGAPLSGDTKACPIGRALYRWSKECKVKIKQYDVFNTYFLVSTKHGLYKYNMSEETEHWFNKLSKGEDVKPFLAEFTIDGEFSIEPEEDNDVSQD